ETGQPAEPFFSDAGTEGAARSQASAQGILVERVEVHTEGLAPPSSAIITSPPQQPREPARPGSLPEEAIDWFPWICLTVGQVLSVLGCVGALVATLMGFAAAANRSKVLGIVEAGWFSTFLFGFCAFCYSAAMYIVFTQAKRNYRA